GFENINEGWATGNNDVLLRYEGSVPVELTSFTAIVKNKLIELNWETASEINNLGFYVERKINNEWETIGFVEGNGTTTELHSYSFNDNISEINSDIIYYRLKQTDFDGTFNYSQVVEVKNNYIPAEYSLFQNHPNPFNPATTIQYQIPKDGLVTIKIYDILGTEVKTLVNEQQSIGRYTINFDAGDLASGVYVYRVQINDFIATKKMMLVK
ncbi:MAG TPA: T9SS type A sorting domain-containing protein, partial [Ignavibacteriaceae bacterium]|nr:T9SS type A sorting domain-containing protein [Ignavibacteriaceae bacterium]